MRQTQTVKQAISVIDIQRDRLTVRQTARQTDTVRQKHNEIDGGLRPRNRSIVIKTKRRDRWSYKPTNRQTKRNTDKHTYRLTY